MTSIAPWALKAMSMKQTIAKVVRAEPSYTPPLLLASSGFEIMQYARAQHARGLEIIQKARDTAARSELEISGAFRRR